MNAPADWTGGPESLDLHQATAGRCMRRSGICDASVCRYHIPGEPGVCALHVAAGGATGRPDIGRLFGISRKAVELTEGAALGKLRRNWIRMYGMAAWEQWRDHLRDVMRGPSRGTDECEAGP